MTRAPSSRWRGWIAERFAGSIGRPASAPSGTAAHGGQLAHPPLAGPHGRGRIALGELDRVVALLDAEMDVLRGDVLADAGEALAALGARDRRRHRFPATPDGP